MTYLYQKIDALREADAIKKTPKYISENLNPSFELRPYQNRAFENFVTYFEGNLCQKPTQVLFHMATGSGKTLIMAGLMMYLYQKGYRNFLFFVNLSNIVQKTKDNFLNGASSKYLFNDDIVIDGEHIPIKEVDNFQFSDENAINICFTTTQQLHMDMWGVRENALSMDDFTDKKIVLISDEAHHLNVETKKKKNKQEESDSKSWEYTIQNIFHRNRDNILLEFTATCDIDNKYINAVYQDKIIFNYPLKNFYIDKYSKDIITLRSDLPLMDRALQALVLSQYRLKVFQDHRLSIKPVILFKAAKIADSKHFFNDFIETVSTLSGAKLTELATNNQSAVMVQAFNYFVKNEISADTLAQELREDFSETHCLSVNDDKDATERQILLNSLEDADNPYRTIFEVKKLDEGWDVLNLFDIVRLYETRQSGGRKISAKTIAEAQLIGRGARYCPFQITEDQPKFQRKYDNDTTNELRVCEELYYHCQNDHRYVSELHDALKEIGLDKSKIVSQQYILKDDFKKEDFYQHGLIFLNNREVKSRKEVRALESNVRDGFYEYISNKGMSGEDVMMMDDIVSNDNDIQLRTDQITIKKIATINYAIVNKSLMSYPIFKFNTLKSYYPNLKSTREFIMSDEYLGKVVIKIKTAAEKINNQILYDAVNYVLGKIANNISNIEETYCGTKEFFAANVKDVFRNKTVNYTEPHDGGVGVSQNDFSVDDKYRIDLSKEDWFVYTDNFGTSEEKAFVAYFKDIVDQLREKYNKIYLIRNEREFHLYSFKEGLRFEPDYVLFLQKNKTDNYEQLQIFIEPKGNHLLDKDAWKEEFLLEMKNNAIPITKFVDDNDYRIWGLHFFNKDLRISDFDRDFSKLL